MRAAPPAMSHQILVFFSSLFKVFSFFSLFFSRWLKAIGVLPCNEEGKVICEIDGLVPGGVQFGVLVQVLFWGVARIFALCWRAGGNEVWGAAADGAADGAVGRSL